jgi:hypothetical protein
MHAFTEYDSFAHSAGGIFEARNYRYYGGQGKDGEDQKTRSPKNRFRTTGAYANVFDHY